MALFTNTTGTGITPGPPKRIISLVPSLTELCWSLGLQDEVVGITKFCVHPTEWFRTKTRVGGTKNVRVEQVKALQPDLILSNKEENVKDQVLELAEDYPVWVSDIQTIPDALSMILAVGELTWKQKEAARLAREIQENFSRLSTPPSSQLRTAYFIWRNPWMVAGGDTFINEMLARAGYENVFSDHARYPSIEPATLAETGCQLVLLSSEPYPFKEQHMAEIREILPDATILLADGEIFSWYGSRLLLAPAYFEHLGQLVVQSMDIRP